MAIHRYRSWGRASCITSLSNSPPPAVDVGPTDQSKRDHEGQHKGPEWMLVEGLHEGDEF